MADAPIPTAPRQTSRGQVSRIDRGYLERPNHLLIARRWLVAACLAAGAGWAAWGAFDQPLHHAPGPVTAVHAKWEQDCQACHVPFAPIKDDTWLSTAATRHEMDAKCESCHRGASHHPLQVSAEVGSCASCHADHRGREADISRVADRTCTACHADIAAHRIADAAGPHSTVDAPITRFDDEHHPAFAGLAGDPGRLKFSHGRHMRAGLTFAPATAAGPAGGWTYAMLAPDDRDRYRPAGVADAAPVQLSCASCHEFGSSPSTGPVHTVSAALAAAPAGAYALPVDFGRHCAACHALPYDGLDGRQDGAAPGELVLPAAAHARTDPAGPAPVAGRLDRTLPHGLDAAGIATFLESRFLKDALAADATLLAEPPAPRRPLPGGDASADAAAVPVRTLVAERVRRGLAFARGTCEKCHDVQAVQLPDAAHLLAGVNAAPAWFEVSPTRVPDIWLKKARFDHGPHRAYDCRECHASAYPDEQSDAVAGGGSPLDNGLVMISGRESCTVCHAPATHDPATGLTRGGARFDCVECHGYHGLGPHAPGPARGPAPTSAPASGATTVSLRGAASHDRSE